MRFEPGERVLGRYVVEGVLGAGGMGEVWRARHERLGRPVAIKTLLGGASTPGMRARFEREAETMAAVSHPNVVSILDYGVTEHGVPCIVMELCDGSSLERVLQGNESLAWPLAAEIGRGLAAGLAAMHAARLVHRDLKPGNVLVAAGDPVRVKLLDLGIARSFASDARVLTREGGQVGTLLYMAPEQILARPVDARADVYAVGLLLYEMVAGRPPFEGEGMESVWRRVQEPAPAPVAAPGREPLPPRLARVILDCLAREPGERPASGDELVRLLRWAEEPAAGSRAPLSVASEAPAPEVDPDEPVRWALVARLPPSRLARPEERQWLATLGEDGSRAYALGAHLWVLTARSEGADAVRARAEQVRAALVGRFGPTVEIAWSPLPQDALLTPAALTGAAPLPPAYRELVARVAG
ncbi:MAG: serine/threonine-protein kinase [Myxococcota bacterium]